MTIKEVTEIEKLRRLIEKENKLMEVENELSTNFYDFEMFDESLLEIVKKNNKEIDYSVLFLLRIFWKTMSETDKDGYDVEDWNFKSYFDCFVENLDKVNLNQKSYRIYFKELVKYVIDDINNKSNNE
jgi:hypothetical protein